MRTSRRKSLKSRFGQSGFKALSPCGCERTGLASAPIAAGGILWLATSRGATVRRVAAVCALAHITLETGHGATAR